MTDYRHDVNLLGWLQILAEEIMEKKGFDHVSQLVGPMLPLLVMQFKLMQDKGNSPNILQRVGKILEDGSSDNFCSRVLE